MKNLLLLFALAIGLISCTENADGFTEGNDNQSIETIIENKTLTQIKQSFQLDEIITASIINEDNSKFIVVNGLRNNRLVSYKRFLANESAAKLPCECNQYSSMFFKGELDCLTINGLQYCFCNYCVFDDEQDLGFGF